MFRRSLSLSMILLAAASCADEPTTPTVDPAGTYAGDTGVPLTGPSTAPAVEIVAGFLRDAGRGHELDQLDVVAEHTDRGMTHVRLEQWIDGRRVLDGYVKATLSSRGELLHVIDGLIATPDTALDEPRIDDTDALRRAMRGLDLTDSTPLYRAPSVEEIAFVDDDGALTAGYLVETWELKTNLLYHSVVDGKGKVVRTELRTNNDRYNVFTEDPGKTPQAVVTGAGWVGAGAQTSTNITGNNAHAYLDSDANNSPDSGGTAVTNGDFLTAADLVATPTTAGNKNVAVQNLFYLNNVVHDTLYAHGFNEAAGNFQIDNHGAGGAGNDPVNAEAQDGSGTDNANMSTPADGSSPRMQMYLWTGNGPDAFVTVGATNYGGKAATFGTALTQGGVNAPIVLVNDGTGVGSDGCEAMTGLTGKIALIDRGTCDFTVKVMNAQTGGAVGVVIANNAPGNPFAMGGTNRRIKIPSMMVAQGDRDALVGVTGTVRKNPTTPVQIDGDIDADIVFHEYGHGLTWRMIGGMSGPLAGAIGEGASDVVAFLINGDPIVGEYAYSDALGIRRYSYEGYPLTYSDVTGAEVHDDGEIYAGAMWRLRGLYLDAGFTAADAMDDFVQGMNFTPSTPTFESMRDGMLAATTTHDCLIWRAFAASGVGVGAQGKLGKGGRLTITESFALPAACQ